MLCWGGLVTVAGKKGGLFAGSSCGDGGSAGSGSCVGGYAAWRDPVDAVFAQCGGYPFGDGEECRGADRTALCGASCFGDTEDTTVIRSEGDEGLYLHGWRTFQSAKKGIMHIKGTIQNV